MSREEFDRAAAIPWIFNVRYSDLHGKHQDATYTVDFSQFRGMFTDRVWLEEITQHLDSVRQDVQRLTQGSAKIHVVTQTRERFLKDRHEELVRYEKEVAELSEPRLDGDVSRTGFDESP